jgi:hypothetical protein
MTRKINKTNKIKTKKSKNQIAKLTRTRVKTMDCLFV